MNFFVKLRRSNPTVLPIVRANMIYVNSDEGGYYEDDSRIF